MFHWEPTVVPDGRLYYVEFPNWGDEMVWGMYDDSGHENPTGLVAEQVGFAYDTTAWKDFVLVHYLIKNPCTVALSDLYAAFFIDFDILDAYNNHAGTDTLRNAAYVWSGSTYAGACLVEPQEPAANVSFTWTCICRKAVKRPRLLLSSFMGVPGKAASAAT